MIDVDDFFVHVCCQGDYLLGTVEQTRQPIFCVDYQHKIYMKTLIITTYYKKVAFRCLFL